MRGLGKMSNLNLQNLNKHRDDILKAEIGALLFNLGKTHVGFSFWRDYFQNLSKKFKWSGYKEYLSEGHFNKEIREVSDNLEGFFDNIEIKINNVIKQLKIKEIMLGKESKEDFVKNIFFRGCENINSGIDKGNPEEQLKSHLWLSNAFGSFKHKIKEEDFDDARIEFFRDLDFFLKRNGYYTNPNWQEIREFIFNRVKPWYSKLLSDSRYPVNDVSLWDQAYMTASMFKAVLSNLVLDSSKLQNYQNNPSSIKWRILGIQYDKLGLAEKGFKPAHIDWYRSISEEIDDEIKKLLELKYPIGNEVYRDETGIYFIVGEDLGKDLEDDKVNLAILKDDLKEIKEEILQIFKEKSLDEFYPAIFLTKASRGLMNLTYLLENARENFLNADWSKKELDICLEKSLSGRANGICQICKQRLVFESDKRDENKNVCEICYEEKTKGRVNEWLKDRAGETIWTAELKDKNDMLALVVMKFELMDWLNGDLLNSLVLQIGINWKDDVDKLASELNNIFKMGQDKKVEETLLKKYTDKALHGLKIKRHNIIESFLLERSIGDRWEEFIKQKLGDKIDFENRKIIWEKLDEKDIDFLATLLLQFLLRKNPSPARIRRIWESTQEFFKEIEEKLLCVANIPDDRRSRLYWENEDIYYEGEAIYNNLEFWIKDKKCYLITYDPELIEKKLKGENKELTLKFENDETINLKLQDAKIEYYKPYMSIIDPTPISWQFIIPAEYVPNLIKNTQTLYDEYFKYVYGKLPLHIGVIIQDYKQPLYVGISALRKIRRDVKDREKLWEEINVKDFEKIFNDKLKKEKIEEKAKKEEIEEKENQDKNNPKEYYSLYFGDLSNEDYKFYISPKDKEYWLKSIDKFQDNEKDEKIKYIPNMFDFEFLDTNTRRNDIYYEESGNCKRKVDLKVNRPYNTEKHFNTFEKFKEAFKEGSSSSKLHNIINIFYEKALLEEELDDGTKKFLASVIINTLEPEKSEKVKTFIQSWLGFEDKNKTHQEIENSISKEKIKMFIDMFEFWHKALKEV
jgi:hypothetical protein